MGTGFGRVPGTQICFLFHCRVGPYIRVRVEGWGACCTPVDMGRDLGFGYTTPGSVCRPIASGCTRDLSATQSDAELGIWDRHRHCHRPTAYAGTTHPAGSCTWSRPVMCICLSSSFSSEVRKSPLQIAAPILRLRLEQSFFVWLSQPKHRWVGPSHQLQCRGMPPQCRGMPPHCRGMPPHCRGMPPQCRGMPPQCRGMPPHCRGMPPHCRGMPPQCRGMPPHCRGMPPHCGACHRSAGACHRSAGACHRTAGACHRSAGACHRSAGACHRTAGACHRTAGACHRTAGACHRSAANAGGGRGRSLPFRATTGGGVLL